MLSEEEIKRIFMCCKNANPKGLYADNVDLTEFAGLIARTVGHRVAVQCALHAREYSHAAHDAIEARMAHLIHANDIEKLLRAVRRGG